MANKERTERITKLVSQAGSVRAAAELIKQIRGVGPNYTSISRATSGAGTDYTVDCYITDLAEALDKKT